MGLACRANFPPELAKEYNLLLEKIGAENMLIQFERQVDIDGLKDLIEQVKDNLYENNIRV